MYQNYRLESNYKTGHLYISSIFLFLLRKGMEKRRGRKVSLQEGWWRVQMPNKNKTLPSFLSSRPWFSLNLFSLNWTNTSIKIKSLNGMNEEASKSWLLPKTQNLLLYSLLHNNNRINSSIITILMTNKTWRLMCVSLSLSPSLVFEFHLRSFHILSSSFFRQNNSNQHFYLFFILLPMIGWHL